MLSKGPLKGWPPTFDQPKIFPGVCENSGEGLRGLAVVELEHAAQPLTTFQRTCSDHLCPGRDELVAEAGVGAVARSALRPSAGAVGGQARYLSRWYG